MPKPTKLVQVPANRLSKIKGLPRAKKVTCKFPLRRKTKAQLKEGLKKFQQSQKPPKLGPVRKFRIKAIDLKSKDVTKLKEIHKSTNAIAAAVKEQKLNAEDTLGLVYSSLVAYEYTKMKAECLKRYRQARTTDAKNQVKKKCEQMVRAFQKAYSMAGLSKLAEKDLDRMSKELSRSRANFNAVANISNTGILVSERPVNVAKTVEGWYEVYEANLPDIGDLVIPAKSNLCDEPIEGSYTKHFSYSFSLKVSLYVPCPKWSNPFRWCWKTFTIAGVSFSAGVDVGYHVGCCGATAWGQGYVEACGSIIGITKCAGCSITISAVVGVGNAVSTGETCSYGLGLNASIICKLAGVTVFNISVPFGWTITGPCPPASLPC